MADAPRSLQQGSQLSSHPNAVALPDVQFNLPLEIWDRITHALLRPRPTAGSGPGQDYSQADLARLMRVSSEWNRRAAPVLYAEVITSDVDKLYSLADSPAANARVASKAQNLGLIRALFLEYPEIVPADTPNADRNSSLYREKADIEDLVTMKRWLEKLGGVDPFPFLLESIRRVAVCSIAGEPRYWMIKEYDDDAADLARKTNDTNIQFDLNCQTTFALINQCLTAMCKFVNDAPLHHFCTAAEFGPLVLPRYDYLHPAEENASWSNPSIVSHLPFGIDIPLIGGAYHILRIGHPLECREDCVAAPEEVLNSAARRFFYRLTTGLRDEIRLQRRQRTNHAAYSYHLSIFADLDKWELGIAAEDVNTSQIATGNDVVDTTPPAIQQQRHTAKRLRNKIRALFARKFGDVDVTVYWNSRKDAPVCAACGA